MLDSVKLLNNVVDYNNFDVVASRVIRQGTYPVGFYIRLWQKDLDLRYIPVTGASLQLNFLRIETVAEEPGSQDVQKAMTQPFSEDGSIWYVELTEDDIADIVSGGIQVVLTEGANVTTLFEGQVIEKTPSSNCALP